jgi:two-component system response regulator (stage 0 sporulation protein A)
MELDLFTQLVQKVETLEEKVGTLEKQLIMQTELLEKVGISDDINLDTYTAPIGDLDFRITALLQELRVPANIKGYTILRETIKLCVQNIHYIDGITKALYPDLAKMFGTTTSRIERNIRHAIEVSYSRAIRHPFYSYFPDNKPTNSEFIALIVDKFRLEQQVKVETVAQL